VKAYLLALTSLLCAACDDERWVSPPRPAPVDAFVVADAGPLPSFDAAPGADATTSADAASSADAARQGPPDVVGGDRPARVLRPTAWRADAGPYPLVVLLHGYGANGQIQDAYLGVSALRDALGFVVVIPEGTFNSQNKRFWNATPACCDFEAQGPDDLAYLRGVVAEVAATHAIDAARVFALGHSNGGYMAYRLACEAAGVFAAVASIAGATFLDAAACGPSRPVSALQVHGTRDEVILYGGDMAAGFGREGYPSAVTSVARHAALNGCSAETVTGDPLDLDTGIDGAESTPLTHTACPAGVDAALWTIEGGTHVPALAGAGTQAILTWLLAHGRASEP
jgi:polyhydroxybutyrate depolymerase